ncbi:linoleate 13S-lipoxygenase 3-1, chloroplastic-like protein [Tanacetum coccineum]
MIFGYGRNRKTEAAFNIFELMQQENVKPNSSFKLCRSGRIDEVRELLLETGEASSLVLASLLGASKFHSDVKHREEIARLLANLDLESLTLFVSKNSQRWHGKMSSPKVAKENKHQIRETEHWLKAILEQKNGLARRIFSKDSVDNTWLSEATDKFIQRQPKAIKENKLFIIDYHDIYLPFLDRINALDERKAYVTRTIFFLTPLGTLKPIAIELSLPWALPGSQPKRVLTPSVDATSNWTWQLAKAHVCSNDAGVHHQKLKFADDNDNLVTFEAEGYHVTAAQLEEGQSLGGRYSPRDGPSDPRISWIWAKRRRGNTPTPGRYLRLRTVRSRGQSRSYSPYSRSRSPRYLSKRDRSRSSEIYTISFSVPSIHSDVQAHAVYFNTLPSWNSEQSATDAFW